MINALIDKKLDWKDIFKLNKKTSGIAEYSEGFGGSIEAQSPIAFKYKANKFLIEVVESNILNIKIGVILTKFDLYTEVAHKGDANKAVITAMHDFANKDFPIVRVGDDYFYIKWNGNKREVHSRKRQTITDDYGTDILKKITKYESWIMEPDYRNYLEVVNGRLNAFNPLPFKLHKNKVKESEISNSISFLKHIFGDQYDLGIKYMKVLYDHPKQKLPILTLVSEQRQTGKTTFLNWLKILFDQNTEIINPSYFSEKNNKLYAESNIILVDEAVFDKKDVTEKFKMLSTAKHLQVDEKYLKSYSLEFFGKIVMTSNRVHDFLKIDKEEVRFWVREVPVLKKNMTNFESLLKEEAPKFIKYLTQLKDVNLKNDRMVFTIDEIRTDNLTKVQEESKSGLCFDLEERVRDWFDEHGTKRLTVSAKDIMEAWYFHNNQINRKYLHKVLRDELKMNSELHKYYPFVTREQESLSSDNISFAKPILGSNKVGRIYVFENKNHSIEENKNFNSVENIENLPF